MRYRTSLRFVSIAVIPAIAFSACGPTDAPADLAIENVTVIDAENGVREGQTVVVDDGRIVSVGPAGGAAAEVVDGSGQYLIPGLWDFHVHLTYDARFTDAMPGLFLNNGITSVRDTGGPLDLVLAAVEAMRAEGATAPRVFYAGPLLDGGDVVYDGENRPLLGIANPDPETARENVAMLAEAGVDFLKIYEMVTPEVFAALVEAAQAHGLPMDGHVPLSMRARDVGPHVQSLEHLRNIELDCTEAPEALLGERVRLLENPDGAPGVALRSQLHNLQRMAAVEAYDEQNCRAVFEAMTETIQVPTLRLNGLGLQPPFERSDWDAELSKLPDDLEAEWRRTTEMSLSGSAPMRDNSFGEWSLRLVGMMHEAGVPMGAGTDTPIGFAAPGYSLHSELEMLVRAGLSPNEALRAATLRPAEFFGMADELGTIEAGRLADLVLLSGNPLDDITNTRTVQAVVTKGELLTRAALDALVN